MIAQKIRFRDFLTTKKGKTIISLILSVLVIVSMITVIAFANIPKEVTILDGLKSIVVRTASDSPEEIISKEGIKLGTADVLDASQFNKENPVLIIKREITVEYSYNGEGSWDVTLPARTVADVISYLGINLSENDVTVPSRFTVLKSGDKLMVFKAGTAKLIADGQTFSVETGNKTVSQILASKNITLGTYDTVNPLMNVIVKNGETIKVTRVVYAEKTKIEKIEYKTIIRNDSSLPEGQTKVETEGCTGKKSVIYKMRLEDGKTVSRSVYTQKILKKAVNKVIIRGTKKISGTDLASVNGINYSRKYTGTASAYYEAPGSMTACGLTVGVGRVGVNPNIIPYGTKLYITGYGYAVAADTGYGVTGMGRLVDLYMNSETECEQWGLRTVTVYILK
jgi:uncharacterized protein YabE (DUF348 family)